MANYAEKLKDPRWQKKRLEIMQRDNFTCQSCFSTDRTLHVHHKYYTKGKEVWDYPVESLVTVCDSCHEYETENYESAMHDFNIVVRQTKFLSNAIAELSHGFIHLDFSIVPEPQVLASCLRWAMEDDEMLKSIVDRYFELLNGGENA